MRGAKKKTEPWLPAQFPSVSFSVSFRLLRVCVGRPSGVSLAFVVAAVAVKTRRAGFDGDGTAMAVGECERDRAPLRGRGRERRYAKQVRSPGELACWTITKERLEWNGSCSQRTRDSDAPDFSRSVCFSPNSFQFLKSKLSFFQSKSKIQAQELGLKKVPKQKCNSKIQ